MLLFDGEENKNVELNNRKVIKEIIPKISSKDITYITALAKELHALNLKECNEPMSKDEIKRADDIVGEVKEFSKKYNISIAINYDPRGLPIRILNDKYRNTLDYDGYAIKYKGVE